MPTCTASTHCATATTLPYPILSRNLDHNRITAVAPDLFAATTELRHLHLSNNAITLLPDGVFDSLGKLITLYFYQNAVAALPDSIFSRLHSLQDLFVDVSVGSAFTHPP